MRCSGNWYKVKDWAEVVEVSYEGDDFVEAQSRAVEVARGKIEDPMVIAWYDQRLDRSFPDVECCSEEMPGWLVYAKSRGGRLVVDVGEGRFLFVFV